MPLIRIGDVAIDWDLVYAVRAVQRMQDDDRTVLKCWIFCDVPHVPAGEPAAKTEGLSESVDVWHKATSDSKFRVFHDVAIAIKKLCGASLADDKKTGVVAIRLDRFRGFTLKLDADSASAILKGATPLTR